MGHAWYLACDMQFYILSPLLIYPIWRWRKLGWGLLVFTGIAAILTPTLQVYYADVVMPVYMSTRV